VNDHGKDKNADAKTACQGKGKAAAAPVGKPKAKAKAKPKAKAKKGTPATGEAGANAKARADAKADAKSRAKRGTAGTFAGRRPPKDAIKRAMFDQMKSSYMTLRLQGLSDEALSGWAARPTKKACTKSSAQQAFLKAMQTRTAELATAGVPGPDRMSTAAAELKAFSGAHWQASEVSGPMAELL
jgi:hypothetical protein